LGDGSDQAAWLSVGVMTSMPSENLTPESAMKPYAGLDVSQKETSLCVVDEAG
jgi:hypothetical protein